MPVYCFRPGVLRRGRARFHGLIFPGKTAYAVKTNGEPIRAEDAGRGRGRRLRRGQPGEFAAVRAVSPTAELLYMHPVKAQSDIRLALETYGIRVLRSTMRTRSPRS